MTMSPVVQVRMRAPSNINAYTSNFNSRTVPITAAIRWGEEHPPAYTPRLVSISAPTPPTGRKLRHLFRRPPGRSASDPRSYPSYPSRPVTDGGGSSTMKRPASKMVPPARQEVVVVEQP